MLKGAMHIHSTYSDGEMTLSELREQLVGAACSFACVTDHAEAFDPDKLRQYTKDCGALSDERFLFIPGLEYECERRMHILAFGLVAPLGTHNPEELIRDIEERGGISVIAHPKDAAFSWIESFSVLPSGLEVWNTKYDGQYAPRPATFRLIERLQQRKPDLLAFYGQDLHWKRQHHGMFNCVWADTVERNAILQNIRGGKYHAVKTAMELPSNGRISEDQLTRFAAIQRRSARVREIFQNAKRAADRVGLRVPDSIKSRLRRIF
jgi:hypothetical protein